VANTADQWHTLAEPIWQRLIQTKTKMVTTSLVLIELGDGLSRTHQRSMALQLHDRLRRSRRVEIVPVDDGLVERGWELFRQRSDKEWGLTDCVSMLVMNDLGLKQVFTSDHHFTQAGFEVLVKGP